jgi:hypothetical protein
VLGEETFGTLVGTPVARDRRNLAHHKPFDVGASGFRIGGVRTIIADLRIGEGDDLSAVGRIGEDFLIAGDGGVEDDFAGALDGRTKASALEDRAVLQGENCLLQIYLLREVVEGSAARLRNGRPITSLNHDQARNTNRLRGRLDRGAC